MWQHSVRYRAKSKKRGISANINPTISNKTLTNKLMCIQGSLFEGKQHQSLVKSDKTKFLNEPKQTKLAKKHVVNTMHTNMCNL